MKLDQLPQSKSLTMESKFYLSPAILVTLSPKLAGDQKDRVWLATVSLSIELRLYKFLRLCNIVLATLPTPEKTKHEREKINHKYRKPDVAGNKKKEITAHLRRQAERGSKNSSSNNNNNNNNNSSNNSNDNTNSDDIADAEWVAARSPPTSSWAAAPTQVSFQFVLVIVPSYFHPEFLRRRYICLTDIQTAQLSLLRGGECIVAPPRSVVASPSLAGKFILPGGTTLPDGMLVSGGLTTFLPGGTVVQTNLCPNQSALVQLDQQKVPSRGH
ncbi:hypothetical protein J7T55_007954 [Diaporthe amygdali]|uniref:uncharacterized protein n=1 Tax=Phomopsis amygdali TaxID=1214568 RepID=UPI0022FF166F|nr:uncharacterized protein J7T55_007954 [Diaporthe amygdali]KAJ0114120.1 hypothetical protein J7T55_007954 [Diaporthe amygdali]